MAQKQTGKILIVEDDNFLLSMYSTKFKQEGFEILAAENGEKGLKLAQEKPDVILLDIILPKMDGFEVLKNLKSQKETADIPVILLTNLSQQDDTKKGMSLGAAGYFIKAHFMPSEVVDKVKSYL
jgi:DNA-binding response OmpR family regulator